MTKEGVWEGKNVDLKQLTKKIESFFHANKFSEVNSFDDPGGNFIQIQARKTGAFQTLTSQRKAIQIIIRGNPSNFLISVSSGEWGKNVTAATLFNPGVSLVGMGLNASFNKKVWNFINDAVVSLENTHKEKITSNPTKTETPLEILQKRLALGEISKEEFDELSSVLGKNASKDTEQEDEKPSTQNYARWVE